MPDDEWLRTLLRLQRDVISRAQALQLITTPAGIKYRLRPGGPWQRLLPGVYLTSTGKADLAQLLMAAQLYAGEPSFITGVAALRLHEIRAGKLAKVDVLVDHGREITSRGFVAIHRTRRLPRSWHHDREIRYTLAARAVADALALITQVDDARAIVAGAVQKRACTVSQLAAELSQRRRTRDKVLRLVLAEVADGVRSVPEASLRQLIAGSGLPQPIYNPGLHVSGTFLARPDVWWPEYGVAAEVDSKEFHLAPADWQATMARHANMTAAGIAVLHFTPSQIRDQPAQVLTAITSALRNGRPLPAITTIPIHI